jgi:hypothetical protein
MNVFSYSPGTAGTAAAPSGSAPVNGYIAAASGVISSNAKRDSTSSADYDYWTIDHERTLRNIQDGVK